MIMILKVLMTEMAQYCKLEGRVWLSPCKTRYPCWIEELYVTPLSSIIGVRGLFPHYRRRLCSEHT